MPRSLILAASGVLLAGVAAFALVNGRPAPRAHGALPHSVYVWQRAWSANVRRAARRHAHAFAETIALGAEITWRSGAPRVARVGVPADVASTRHPLGVALRIGPSPRAPGSDEADTALVAGTAASLVQDARAAGVAPAELQLDYDCAESRLDGYRTWIAAVRTAVAPTPVTITALPAWLDQRAFAPLVRASDGFVLQVHSIEPPADTRDPAPLCDPDRAARWVEAAARAGVPFRVALPTCGYVLGWSKDGRFLGVGAEGPEPGWPAGALLRELPSDAAAMTSLVRRWRTDRPAQLAGIVWYRLPVDGDARNWRWTTLARVMRGRNVAASVVARTRQPVPQLADVSIANRGDADGAAESAVDVAWSGAHLVAWDASRGFELVQAGEGRARFRPIGATGARLAPRDGRSVGWLRFDAPAEVECHVVH